MKGKIKVKVTDSLSDWFHTVEKDLRPDLYDKFILRACNLAWYLEAYRDNVKVINWHIEEPEKLINELNISELVGNKYRTLKELVI